MSDETKRKNQRDFLTLWYDETVTTIDQFRYRLLTETNHPLAMEDPDDPRSVAGKKMINNHNTKLRNQCLLYVIGPLDVTQRSDPSSKPQIDDPKYSKFVERKGVKRWHCRQLPKAGSGGITFSYPTKEFIADMGDTPIAAWW